MLTYQSASVMLLPRVLKQNIHIYSRTHMQDLKDVTNNVHYENYRYNKLASVSQDGKSKGSGKYVQYYWLPVL